VTGSLAIGVLVVVLTERLVADPAWRLLLVVGFLGGYTTF
jgi:fluoride ion exporter CrcB/FEX